MRFGDDVVDLRERDDVQPAILEGRAAIDEQFRMAERLDAKARGQLTIAGAWFAVVQAVAAKAFDVDGLAVAWVWAIGGLAALGSVALLVTAALSAQVWKLRDEPRIHPDSVVAMANELRDPGADADAQGKLVATLADMLDKRMKTNALRARALEKAQLVWYGAMLIALLELCVSFTAQALG